jgi:hypothetical protein
MRKHALSEIHSIAATMKQNVLLGISSVRHETTCSLGKEDYFYRYETVLPKE